MTFDPLSFVVLFFALIVVSLIQATLALGIMYAMHKYWEEKLTEKTYVGFDFDNFQKGPFQEMVTRLALIFLAPTMVLHLLYYLIFNTRKSPGIANSILFVLETAAIAAGLYFIFKLDRFRLLVLGASGALIYLFVLAFLRTGNLFS